MRRLCNTVIAGITALSLSAGPLPVFAQKTTAGYLNLPPAGTLVHPSAAFEPIMLKGLRIDPLKPLAFSFIVDAGQSGLPTEDLKTESQQLARYFLAALAVPDKDLWVNLSPFEKERVIPGALGVTDLGKDMLAQDYMLKQLAATLIHPESQLGKEFWKRIYSNGPDKTGSAEMVVNTFNKVWIVPGEVEVFEKDNMVYITKAQLKVLLDEDYLAQHKSTHSTGAKEVKNQHVQEILRALIVPEIEKEVNDGKNFAPLRQLYGALILAKWYKESLKESLLKTSYIGQNKVEGIDIEDKQAKDKIFKQYQESFKKGVFNFIKEEVLEDGKLLPRKYFSGGAIMGTIKLTKTASPNEYVQATQGRKLFDLAMSAVPKRKQVQLLSGQRMDKIKADQMYWALRQVEGQDHNVIKELYQMSKAKITTASIPHNYKMFLLAYGILEIVEFNIMTLSPDGRKFIKAGIKENEYGLAVEPAYEGQGEDLIAEVFEPDQLRPVTVAMDKPFLAFSYLGGDITIKQGDDVYTITKDDEANYVLLSSKGDKTVLNDQVIVYDEKENGRFSILNIDDHFTIVNFILEGELTYMEVDPHRASHRRLVEAGEEEKDDLIISTAIIQHGAELKLLTQSKYLITRVKLDTEDAAHEEIKEGMRGVYQELKYLLRLYNKVFKAEKSGKIMRQREARSWKAYYFRKLKKLEGSWRKLILSMRGLQETISDPKRSDELKGLIEEINVHLQTVGAMKDYVNPHFTERFKRFNLAEVFPPELKFFVKGGKVKIQTKLEEGLYINADPRVLRLSVGRIIENAVSHHQTPIVEIKRSANAGFVDIVISNPIDVKKFYEHGDLLKEWHGIQRMFLLKHARKQFNEGGLGMPFTYNAVKKMGGSIRVERYQESGQEMVRFIVTFPEAKDAAMTKASEDAQVLLRLKLMLIDGYVPEDEKLEVEDLNEYWLKGFGVSVEETDLIISNWQTEALLPKDAPIIRAKAILPTAPKVYHVIYFSDESAVIIEKEITKGQGPITPIVLPKTEDLPPNVIMFEDIQREYGDRAMLPRNVGGIDLKGIHLTMTGSRTDFNLSQAQADELADIIGLSPMIISLTPVTNPLSLIDLQ